MPQEHQMRVKQGAKDKPSKHGSFRAQGALLGCAVGDALGITQEIFVERPNHLNCTFQQVREQRMARKARGHQTELEGGGPWEHITLEAGEWTDDTAMLLCLCDSILQRTTVDTPDLVTKFRSWWYQGYNACRHKMSLGLGGNTQEALERFDPENPLTLTGGSNPDTDAGNGALMRLAPVPAYWHQDLDTAMLMARKQAQTTHNVQEAMDSCALMTFIMWHAINGLDKAAVFNMLPSLEGELLHAEVAELATINAKWRSAPEQCIITLPSRCLWTLEAALWCVFHTSTFEDAVLTAVNLGGDADTVGAITGQIAGALYGVKCIPEDGCKGSSIRTAFPSGPLHCMGASHIPPNWNCRTRYLYIHHSYQLSLMHSIA